jgi:ribosomal protein L29
MKKKEKTQLHSMKKEELQKAVIETKEKLAQILVNRYSKQSKNVRDVRALRHKIAVAMTILHTKEQVHE